MTEVEGRDWSLERASRRRPAHSTPLTRLAAVRRLPVPLLPVVMIDAEPAVRREVARLIGEEWLPVMAWDDDAGVRLIVAERLRPEQLPALARDSDVRVRAAVARRVVPSALARLAEDGADEVCRMARLRLGWSPHRDRRLTIASLAGKHPPM